MPVQRCTENGKPGWRWGEHGKCYTGPDAKAKANAQGAKIHIEQASLVLTLQTMPAVSLATEYTPKDLVRYRKELIKVGRYVQDAASPAFEVTLDMLHHWAATFRKWVQNGNKVSIPPGHDKANRPEENQGWVENMFVEGNSLFGILRLLNPELALVTDVSIGVPAEVIDGRGHKYTSPIEHVSLTTRPVVTGLKGFKKLSLSLSKENTMDLKKLAALLNVEESALTEEINE